MIISYKRKQAGDTIVEVMIAAAIAGLVLVGAYSAANKSSLQIRNAQENSEAQKVAIAAIENLNTVVRANNTPPNSWLDAAYADVPIFCSDGTAAATTSLGGAAKTMAEVDQPGTVLSSATDCVTTDGRYRTFIERKAGTGDIFTVRVRWDGVNGNKQTVSIVYKVRIQ